MKNLTNNLFETLRLVLINTIGIWMTYLLTRYIGSLFKLNEPSFDELIKGGALLISNFSILLYIISITTISNKINWYNSVGAILFCINMGLYAIVIAHDSKDFNIIYHYYITFATIAYAYICFRMHNKLVWKYSWLRNAKTGEKKFNIFLAFAIAGNKDAIARKKVENSVDQIKECLEKLRYNKIFDASQYFDREHHKQEPVEAATEDFMAVEQSKNMILFYPDPCPTSALMELGYALSMKKNILIITRNKEKLPFLARGLDVIHDNVCILSYKNFTEVIDKLKRNHKTYFTS